MQAGFSFITYASNVFGGVDWFNFEEVVNNM